MTITVKDYYSLSNKPQVKMKMPTGRYWKVKEVFRDKNNFEVVFANGRTGTRKPNDLFEVI